MSSFVATLPVSVMPFNGNKYMLKISPFLELSLTNLADTHGVVVLRKKDVGSKKLSSWRDRDQRML